MPRKPPKNIHYLITLAIIFLSFLLVTIRLFSLQVLNNDKFQALALQQHWHSRPIFSFRGEVLSSDGYRLAANKSGYLLYAEPRKINNPQQTAKALLPILNQNDEDENELLQKLEEKFNSDLYWVILSHKINEEQKAKIHALGIKGLGFEEEPIRFYPEGNLTSSILGFVGYNEQGEEQGYYGIEGFYDGDLKGYQGKIFEEVSALGDPILMGQFKSFQKKDGRDLVLTINRSLQFMVRQKLANGLKKYGAEAGTVIIQEPETGKILTMVNLTNNPQSELINPAISETYEPGSVMKGLTMSAAIDTKTVTPQTEFVDSGPIKASGYTVDNWDGKHHGRQNMIQVLQKSNNMGAAFVAKKLGPETLKKYFLKFGLGKITGIDLEGEDSGTVKPLDEWREIDLVTSAFGQGISNTPLQLVNAFSAIVNDGVLMKPQVVQEIHDSKKIIEFELQKIRRVISSQTAQIMQEMLTQAVAGGESKFFNIKTHKVAGKTGTAQIPAGGKYDPHKTNVTFVGFLPSSKKFVMLVKLNKPSSSIYAAETAVPLWMEICQELIVYWGIPSDL